MESHLPPAVAPVRREAEINVFWTYLKYRRGPEKGGQGLFPKKFNTNPNVLLIFGLGSFKEKLGVGNLKSKASPAIVCRVKIPKRRNTDQ